MTEEKSNRYYSQKAWEEIDRLWRFYGHDNFDLGYNWIMNQPELRETISKAQDDFDEACKRGDPPNQIRQWAGAWYRAWKKAVGYATRYIMTRKDDDGKTKS